MVIRICELLERTSHGKFKSTTKLLPFLHAQRQFQSDHWPRQRTTTSPPPPPEASRQSRMQTKPANNSARTVIPKTRAHDVVSMPLSFEQPRRTTTTTTRSDKNPSIGFDCSKRNSSMSTLSASLASRHHGRTSSTWTRNCTVLLVSLAHLAGISIAIATASSTKQATATLGQPNHSIDQLVQQVFSPSQLSKEGNAFDTTPFKSIHEAIRSHPDLREFAGLCETKEVREIIGMDRTPLTVFAPIDRSLGDLLQKSKTRSINLIELAKHHIVQGFVMPDETTKYPLQLKSYAMLSPLYLNQAQQHNNKLSPIYINNARILASHLIQIDATGDQYQTLHLIDAPLEFAYVNRRTQIRSIAPGSSSSATSGSASSASLLSSSRFATVRKPLSLDDLGSQADANEQSGAIEEFFERFGDLQTSQPLAELYHVRALRQQQPQQQQHQRIATPAKDQLNLERLGRMFRQTQQLRGKLFNLSESNTLNTYFLPIYTDELETILKNPSNQKLLAKALEAHVIPNQVLFTRPMEFGSSFSTWNQNGQRVSLNLVKTLPTLEGLTDNTNDQLDNLDSLAATVSSRLLTTPLELEAKCELLAATNSNEQLFRSGLTNAEIVIANIPLSNGVLHLIRRPILLTDGLNLLDYLNDDDNQLTNVVHSLGSRSRASGVAMDLKAKLGGEPEPSGGAKVNRFRELLAKERQILSTFSQMGGDDDNRTILAPTDEAFARLRYDLRALIEGDETLIPQHWDSAYRRDLLERLVKRHIIAQQTLTGDQLIQLSPSVLSANGQIISFQTIEQQADATQQPTIQVECDSTRSQVIYRDLIGSNGVLHLIDRVLGEEQETIYSLMQSLILKYSHARQQLQSSDASPQSSPASFGELRQLIEHNLLELSRSFASMSDDMASHGHPNSISIHSNEGLDSKPNSKSPELLEISKTIGQFLDELHAPNNRHKLQLLSQSVNISYQLARLTSKAEGQFDDWNDKFKSNDKQFTYFVPNDLAWIRLQQAQPELYKPLVYFLEQQQLAAANSQPSQEAQSASGGEQANSIVVVAADQQQQQNEQATGTAKSTPRSSESSHRLLQILERHLVANRRLSDRELNQLDSVQTIGATLRLVDQPRASSLATNQQQTLTDGSNQASAFAALHSIVSGSTNQQEQQLQGLQANSRVFKSLRLNKASANIVQINETYNGFVYIIDNVLVLPDDADYIVQTSSNSAISSSMSSLLGAHNSAILDFIQNLLSPASSSSILNTYSMLTIIGTLTVAILILLIVTTALIVRRHRQNKLNRHHQLESGLTSASSANSGSTSTTKSL